MPRVTHLLRVLLAATVGLSTLTLPVGPAAGSSSTLTVLASPTRVFQVGNYPKTFDGLYAIIPNERSGSGTFKVAGRAGIPTSARSVVANVSLGRTGGPTVVRLNSCSSDTARTRELLTTTHPTVMGLITIPLTDDGSICFTSTGGPDIAIDVVAWSTAADVDVTSLATSNGVTPISRSLSAGEVVALPINALAGKDVEAAAALLQITVTAGATPGELRTWSPGANQPGPFMRFRGHASQEVRVIAPIGTLDTTCLRATSDVNVTVTLLGLVDGPPTSSASATCDTNSSVTWSYTVRKRSETQLILSDHRGRNLTGGLPNEMETLVSRDVFVRATFPSNAKGEPTSRKPMPLRIQGVYREGSVPSCRSGPTTKQIEVCISFPFTQNGRPQFADIINHPRDVSAVLDLLIANPAIAGRIDTTKIWYTGGSMGGVTGIAFVYPANRDPRIKAVVSNLGAVSFWLSEYQDVNNWNAGPLILMTNNMDDPIITYQMARKAMELGLRSPRVTALTYFRGGHGGTRSPNCRVADSYAVAWEKWAVFGGRAPSTSAVDRSNCARFGIQPGGTTGWGTADALVPPEYK